MDFLCPPVMLGRVNLMARFMAICVVLFCFADPFSYQYTRDRRLNQYLRISSNVASVNDLPICVTPGIRPDNNPPLGSILATILAFTNTSIAGAHSASKAQDPDSKYGLSRTTPPLQHLLKLLGWMSIPRWIRGFKPNPVHRVRGWPFRCWHHAGLYPIHW